jgi:hypothetical protein
VEQSPWEANSHSASQEKSRDSSVEWLATGWTIGVLGFDSRRGLGIFLFTTASVTALGPTQPPIQWVVGFSLGIKRPGREADHLPPSSAEVKNVWSYTFTPQYVFLAWCLVQLVKKFLRFYGPQRFITVFKRAHCPRPCVTFRNKLFFLRRGVVSPRSTRKVEDHPL